MTSGGRPNLAALAEQLDGVSYEVLRRAARGKTRPSSTLLEEVARVLGLRADYFLECRIADVVQRLDPRSGTTSETVRLVERLRSVLLGSTKDTVLPISEAEEPHTFDDLPPLSDEAHLRLLALFRGVR